VRYGSPLRGGCRNPRDVVEVSPRRQENYRHVILSPEEISWPSTSSPATRDQPYLLPPSLKDWLPEDHLAFFLLDAVKEMDLRSFYVGYREDGWGGTVALVVLDSRRGDWRDEIPEGMLL
jgi:hypothetical protein